MRHLKLSVSVLLSVLILLCGATAAFAAGELPIKGATPSSQHADYAAEKAIDGDVNTFWHTNFGVEPKVVPPHWITLDLGEEYLVSGLKYLGRQDGNPNGVFTEVNVYVSSDNNQFTKVTSATWEVNGDEKSLSFDSVKARYVKVESVQDRVGSAAEVKIIGEKVAVESKTTETAKADNPKTGDTGVTTFALIALISAILFILAKKTKLGEN
jgi:LPXTG-motif cell wall-anchored protein